MAFRNRINCFVCNTEGLPRVMRRLILDDDNQRRREIAARFRHNLQRLQADANELSRVCLNCSVLINREIELENDPSCTLLNILRLAHNNVCFMCHNANNLQLLSLKSRTNIYLSSDIYVPDNARCCPVHLNENGYLHRGLLPGLQFLKKLYRLTGEHLTQFLGMIRELSRFNEPDLNDVNTLTEDEFALISPITKNQFDDLLQFCRDVPDGNNRRRVKRKDLLIFLCKLRQGLPDDFLKLMFNVSSRQAVSLTIAKVRQSLMIDFVPQNIGLNAITREEYIEHHVTEFANALYNVEENVPKAIVYIDGTYSYVEKSSNFQTLRQSYCLHKSRHLIKPALMVAPDGYILDIHGPYFSDARNNDAAMLQDNLENDGNALREWLGEEAIVIADRGYRDVVPLLQRLGFDARIPPIIRQGDNQLQTEDANESRLITKTRWVIEARNGHIKSVFKFFKNIISHHHATHLREFYLIAGAILNRYREQIVMDGATAEVARNMLERARTVNRLQERVERENLARLRAVWNPLNANIVIDFPVLNMDYLTELTIGIYQLKLAPAYVQDQQARDDNNEFHINLHRNEPGFLHCRFYSRFRNQTRYQLWIQYNVGNNNVHDEPITGYYCTCKTGARTLGTCAHIASVLWYLGYARHQPNIKYPNKDLLNNISDAAHRYDNDVMI